MADTKVTALTEDTAPASDSLVYTVDDPGGTPASRKTTLGNFIKGLIVNNLTAKTTPVGADEVMLGDSAASNVAKKATLTNFAAAVRGLLAINGATDKATPVAADELLIGDSEASNAIKKADIASVVTAGGAVMKSTFDANTVLAANSDNTPAAVTVAEQRIVGRVTSGNIAALTGTQARTIVASAVDANAETASFTFALADAGLWTTISNSSATTATIPPNSSVAFAVGTILTLEQISTGACTWTAGSGVTINVISTKTKVTNGQYAVSFARKTATDTWTVYGDLVAA